MPVDFTSPAPWQQQKFPLPKKIYHSQNGSIANSNKNTNATTENSFRTGGGRSSKRRQGSGKSKIQVDKDQNLLKSAKDEGFLQALTEDELLKNSQNLKNKQASYPGDVRILSLRYRRLLDISLADLCEKLEICVLSNNFIQDIEPLKWCPNLYCLDVHSNQLNHIPSKKFWGALSNLTLVYMHDNGLSRLEEVKFLAHSPSLCALTLYDSPLSLKKNYRHCVVNAVWTLKALDNYVISDEEIIEDAKFTEQFKPLRRQFFYQFTFCSEKKRDQPLPYNEAHKLIKEELVKINSIQSKFCPVIMIQKCIRGFMVRLKYNYIKDTRLWAAVSIQRFYRDYKGYPNPPPTSPTLQYQDHLYQSLSSIRLDYETYLRLRRSRHKSTLSVKSLPYRLQLMETPDKMVYNVPGIKEVSPNNTTIQRHISIDLKKLEGQTTEILNKDSLKSGSSQMPDKIPKKPEQSLNEFIDMAFCTECNTPSKQIPENIEEIADQYGLSSLLKDGQLKRLPQKIGKYHTQYAFLGQVETDRLNKEETEHPVEDSNYGTRFRLTIRRPDILTTDPLEEIILRTIEGADDIRQATREIDRKVKSAPLPVIARPSGPRVGHIQKSFLKTNASMSFSAFQAVEKAYKDRDASEVLMKKAHRVRQIKKEESIGRTKVKRTKRNYKNQACVKKHSDRVAILEELEARRRKLADLQDKTAALKISLEDNHDHARENYKFSLNFRCQNASVGKALLNHDHNKRRVQKSDQKTQLVENLRSEYLDKKNVLKDYKDQKVLIRQAETAAAREEIDMKLLKNSAKRELELREHLKKHQEKQLRQLRSPTVLAVTELQSRDILVSPDHC